MYEAYQNLQYALRIQELTGRISNSKIFLKTEFKL